MKRLIGKMAIPALLALTLAGCGFNVDSLVKESTRQFGAGATGLAPPGREVARPPGYQSVPMYTYRVVKSWPHLTWAFTQGIVFHDGVLLESTGLYGRSSIIKVAPGSGQVLARQNIAEEHFGEGMTVFKDRVYQLTLSNTGFIYNRKSLKQVGEFSYQGEGWGLTHDEQSLIMSDGSNRIRFLDPETFKPLRTIEVSYNNIPLKNLNALQYVKGEIFANIWQSDYIVRIDPRNGKILGWINLKGLQQDEDKGGADDVLNGIAYDEESDRLVVTGKRWSKYFEISLHPAETART